jgi:hypothetical protein
MEALDANVITNFMIAQTVTILLLIDELEKLHPGLKSRYGAVLDVLIADEEARTRRDEQALTVLRAMRRGVKRKAKSPRTLH